MAMTIAINGAGPGGLTGGSRIVRRRADDRSTRPR